MKKNNELPILGKKGTVAGLVLCFVAMITLVGAFTFSQYQDNISEEFAEAEFLENSITQEELIEKAELDILETEEANTTQIINDIGTENTVAEHVKKDDTILEEIIEQDTSMTNASIEDQISYNGESELLWPVNGGVIMMYSMDQAIYFATLDQYKKNSAMIIDGEVGTEVLAGEMGIVQSITEEAQTGTTLTMDMGNGYSAVYGQLADVRVTEGSVVEKGQVIGVLAEPTKYYSTEGCNLYFQMLKDGETVDPLDYLDQ